METYRSSKSKSSLKILFENKFLLSRNNKKINHYNIKKNNSNTNSIFIQRSNILKSSFITVKSSTIKKNKNKIIKNYSSAYTSQDNGIAKSENKRKKNLNHKKHKSLNLNKILSNIKNELSLEKENRELKRKILLLEKENSILFKKNQRYKYLESLRNIHQSTDLNNIDASYNYYVTTGNKNENNKSLNSNSNGNVVNIIYRNPNKKEAYKKIGNKYINIINNFNKNYSYLTIDSRNIVYNSRSRKSSGLCNLKNLNSFKDSKSSFIAKTEYNEKNKIDDFKSIKNENKKISITKASERNNKKIDQLNHNSIGGDSDNIRCVINVNKRKNIRGKSGTDVRHKYLSSQEILNSMNQLMERTKNLLISYNNLSRDLSKNNMKKK